MSLLTQSQHKYTNIHNTTTTIINNGGRSNPCESTAKHALHVYVQCNMWRIPALAFQWDWRFLSILEGPHFAVCADDGGGMFQGMGGGRGGGLEWNVKSINRPCLKSQFLPFRSMSLMSLTQLTHSPCHCCSTVSPPPTHMSSECVSKLSKSTTTTTTTPVTCDGDWYNRHVFAGRHIGNSINLLWFTKANIEFITPPSGGRLVCREIAVTLYAHPHQQMTKTSIPI